MTHDTAPGLLPAARALIARDARLVWRRRGDALQPALFALLVVTLFALALGGEREALARSAGAVLWLAVLLAGLLRPDAGEIRLTGHVLGGQALRASAHDASERAHVMAYLGHLPGFKGDLTALENLEFLCGLHGRRPTQTPEGAMAVTGLAGFEDALARQLSAGQKKRLSLARMWLSPAPLWLLDEPYANLDLAGIELVNRMIQAHLNEGGATLVTTHGAYAAPPVRMKMLVMRRRGDD